MKNGSYPLKHLKILEKFALAVSPWLEHKQQGEENKAFMLHADFPPDALRTWDPKGEGNMAQIYIYTLSLEVWYTADLHSSNL